MSRARTDAITVKPSNNAFTALTGAACVCVLVALVMLWLKWSSVVGTDPEAPKLFFGFF